MPIIVPRARIPRLAVAVILVVALAGYSLWWAWLAHSSRDGIANWAAARNAAGWTVSTGAIDIDGFPFAMRLTLAAPAVSDPGGNSWQGPPLVARVSPLRPHQPRIEAPGRHLFTPAGRSPIELTAARASAELGLDAAGVAQVELGIGDGAVAGITLGQGRVALRRLASGRVEHGVPTLAVSAQLERLTLPNDPRLVLGHVMDSARLEARIRGSLAGGPVKESLAAWRDDGGTVELDALSLVWPPLALSGKGTLALDRDLQPELASSGTVRGLFEALDALARSRVVRPQDAGMAKVVLGLLTRPAADGVQELTIPLTLENRILYVGRVGLTTLPAVEW